MSCVPIESPSAPNRSDLVVAIEFEANDGSRWRAIGGGHSLEDAIEYARESVPAGRYWRVIDIADLYGE